MTASEEMKTIDKYAERHKVTRKKISTAHLHSVM